jgi:hypothetical protein
MERGGGSIHQTINFHKILPLEYMRRERERERTAAAETQPQPLRFASRHFSHPTVHRRSCVWVLVVA